MKIRYILLGFGLLVTPIASFAANEVGCKCVDRTIKNPRCGLCGSEGGIMEQTETGANCYCMNDLKLKEASCAEACSLNGGWTGEFRNN